MRKGNSQSSPGAFNRLLWMVGIWGASVAALGVMAMAVRLAMSLSGMKP